MDSYYDPVIQIALRWHSHTELCRGFMLLWDALSCALKGHVPGPRASLLHSLSSEEDILRSQPAPDSSMLFGCNELTSSTDGVRYR